MSPRIKRTTSKTNFYYVMLLGNDENIFPLDADKEMMLDLLFEKAELDAYEIYAYCILNNSAHFVIKTSHVPLWESVKKICVSYASYYNRKNLRNGHVFNDRFKSFPIDDENTFCTTVKYIHSLPSLMDGYVPAQEYSYSSMMYYIKRCEYIGTRPSYNENITEKLFIEANKMVTSFANMFSFLCTKAPFCFDEGMIAKALIGEYMKDNHFDISQINEKENVIHRDNLVELLHECANFSIRKISLALGVNRGMVHKIILKLDSEDDENDL